MRAALVRSARPRQGVVDVFELVPLVGGVSGQVAGGAVVNEWCAVEGRGYCCDDEVGVGDEHENLGMRTHLKSFCPCCCCRQTCLRIEPTRSYGS